MSNQPKICFGDVHLTEIEVQLSEFKFYHFVANLRWQALDFLHEFLFNILLQYRFCSIIFMLYREDGHKE